MRYFDHDTTASSDSLIMSLRLEHGGAAVDAYYTILEEIYLAESPLNIGAKSVEMTAISHRLATDKQTLSDWLQAMLNIGLLVQIDDEDEDAFFVTSERAQANILAYQEKCEKARQAGKKGGRISKRKADAKRTLSERQAKKRKEKKGIETYSVSNSVPLNGADAEESAPYANELKSVFDEVDSIPCPDYLNPYKVAQ